MKNIPTFEAFLNEAKDQYEIDDYSKKMLLKYFKNDGSKVNLIWDELCNTAKEQGSKLVISNISQVLDAHGAKKVTMVDELHLIKVIKDLFGIKY